MSTESMRRYAVVGIACRLPAARDVQAFERLLFSGRSAIGELPDDRLDRSLYFDSARGKSGKTYTLLGGIVPESPLDPDVWPSGNPTDFHDPAHLLFCETAMRAWKDAGLMAGGDLAARAGIYVGHSGGTKLGGQLSLATQISEALEFLKDLRAFRGLNEAAQNAVIHDVESRIRADRPQRTSRETSRFHAYCAASLAAERLGFHGPRQVVDAACASSLLALNHATLALDAGRIDAAVVGGATYNNVDNLILFSHSQACSDQGSRPFDNEGSGLVSSEGYVAVAIMRFEDAVARNLPIRAVVRGIGVSSDGRGKSLWAPRREGQELAIRRAYGRGPCLTIDYLEAHATSTQLGDATELESLTNVRTEAGGTSNEPLLIGSVKSNIGHTLEAAGLVGLVKLTLALERNEIPPSINYRSPTTRFDWSTGQVQVVDHTRPWPDTRPAKRGAVNAFGIGGLNAHVCVEETSPETNAVAHRTPRGVPFADEPIAIVGRGAVLPGASNVRELLDLLRKGKSVIGDAPADRWRGKASPSESRSAPTRRGGYITNYTFDGEAYRIPPKQVRQANPLQMMLLDAVTQAMQECDGGTWKCDKTRTGVVVGTAFGGEFSNQLQIGLRLPEIMRELRSSLEQRGAASTEALKIAEQFREEYLKSRPALLDETGSFTASTLASRIAKTFDLMGGACAIDAEDASGLAALSLSVDLLRSGQCDAMICGAGHRAMDLVAFEHLSVSNRLVQSGSAEDVPENLAQVLPGEGVAVLALRRLSDARREGLPILGIIDQVTTGENSTPGQPAVTRVLAQDSARDAELVRTLGYVAGAHAIIRMISECGTLNSGLSSSSAEVNRNLQATSITEDGFEIKVDLRVAAERTPGEPMTSPLHQRITTHAMTGSSRNLTSRRLIRLRGTTEHEIRAALQEAISNPSRLWAGQPSFSAQDVFRAAILAESEAALSVSAKAILARWDRGIRRGVFESEQAILWNRTSEQPRVAWLFPGQGSQYTAEPAIFSENENARGLLKRLDVAADSEGTPSFTSTLLDSHQRLGTDVWCTQAWVLAASACLSESLRSRGHRPDVVLGHSFGEFTAAIAAGVMTLEQGIRMSRQRAEAVALCYREQGVLLSVRAMPTEVQAVLRQNDLSATVTHHNAPRQTVIACLNEHLKTIQSALTAAGLASIRIPVPAAFHTPMMAEAEDVFGKSVAEEPIRPPVCGFLSATTASYLAEPVDVRRSLVAQLTRPVLYEPAIRRLTREGCELFIEIGPNDVLTRLNREILGKDVLALSLDVPGKSFADRLALVEAAVECVSGTSQNVVAATQITSRIGSPVTVHQALVADDVEIIDVRAKARRSEDSREPIRHEPQQAESSRAITTEPVDLPMVASTQSSEDAALVAEFLVNLTVELTGYSREVIDLDADIEADLGLDSIKKAQMIGELSEWAGLSINPSQLRLTSLSTLRDIAALAGTLPVSAIPAADVSEQPAAIVSVPQSAIASTSHDAEMIEQLLIDFVVDQTGYSRKIIDLDADLEADLGVDSIKRAQLLGEMHEQFNLSGIRPERIVLNQFPTLRSIRDFLLTELGERGKEIAVPSREMVEFVSSVSEASTPPARAAIAQIEAPASEPVGIAPSDRLPEDLKKLFHVETVDANSETQWKHGHQHGLKHREQIRSALRALVGHPGVALSQASTVQAGEELQGMASGAGVSLGALIAAVRAVTNPSWPSSAEFTTSAQSAVMEEEPETHSFPPERNGHGSFSDRDRHEKKSTPHANNRDLEDSTGTQRFALRMVAAPRRPGMPATFELKGPALILGSNSIAEAIAARIRKQGQKAVHFSDVDTPDEVKKQLEQIWRENGLTPHLFITTPHDRNSLRSVEAADWKRRRMQGVQTPFLVCQAWMERMIAANRMDDGSVLVVANQGGDFGFSGRKVVSPEGGGVGGLVKAMVIESWMRGFRTTPMKVIDIAASTAATGAVEGIWRELAVPSYDMELSNDGDQRMTVQAVAASLPATPSNKPRPRGAWIVSGGGRGITALTAMALAEQHDLTLHLLGTAPVPQVSAAMRAAAIANRGQLRRDIMREASSRGENAIEAWRDAEKALEIDITLAACQAKNIRAKYHCCDVSDAAQVEKTLQAIRRKDGPIRGVIHGAGAGQDARFDRKRPDKVDKCIRAKVDGALALMSATKTDPIEWFVAFGSISGRFGANGHTDYSLANDMLAKVIDLYRAKRPEVTSLTFHWHAWGDVGMATKPEAKLALEMIDMEFMPAADGVRHFLREFESGGDEPEVLITDHRYYRKFFPAERIVDATGQTSQRALPLLEIASDTAGGERASATIRLDPVKDLFLSQHLVNGRPTLPFVVAMELLAEAAQLSTQMTTICSRHVEALQALKFATDEPMDVTVSSVKIATTDPSAFNCVLQADLRRRDGRLVEAGREYFRGEFLLGDHVEMDRVPWPDLNRLSWEDIVYSEPDALIYHGPELRSLKRFAISENAGFGQIGASAPVQLFGGDRPARGWTVSCDTMDACLYACALFGWKRHQKPSLPVRFQEITFGRLPDPGEPCLVTLQEQSVDESGMEFSFRLLGQNGDVLLDVEGYRVAWLQV